VRQRTDDVARRAHASRSQGGRVQTHSQAAFNPSSIQAFRMPLTRRGTFGKVCHAPVAPALAHADLRILIVNEDMRSAAALKRTLYELGYRTTFTAYSAKRALVAADDFSPTVALLDLELPDMSGFQLAQQLRAHTCSHVRRVSLFAIADKNVFGNNQLARAAGFAGYLTKPVLPLELNGLLRDL
jgi:CheY-like chemotaxis protein